MKHFLFAFTALLTLCSCSPRIYDAANATFDKKLFAEQYKLNKAEWDAAFEFLQRPDLAELKAGQYEVLGRTYAKVQIDRTRDEAHKMNYEVHRNGIDLFLILEGSELINVSRPENLVNLVSPYNEKKDVEYYAASADFRPVVLTKGKYVVLFPTDGHQPMLAPDGTPAAIHKVIIKLPYVRK